MRYLELLLLLLLAVEMGAIAFAQTPKQNVMRIAGPAALAVIITHLVVDGYRWQMILIYVLTIIFGLVLWRRSAIQSSSDSTTCHREARCRAVINLDGGEFFVADAPLLDTEISKPLLMVNASNHPAPTPNNPGDFNGVNDLFYESIATRGTRRDVLRLGLTGTSHMHMSDMHPFAALVEPHR